MSSGNTAEPDAQSRIKQAKELAATGDSVAAMDILRGLVDADTPYPLQLRAARLLGGMDLAPLGLQRIKVALLASSTVDHLVPLVRYWLARNGINADIWVAPYDTIAATCFDPAGALYDFAPDIIWFFTTWRDVDLVSAPGMTAAEAAEAAANAVQRMTDMVDAAQRQSGAQIIVNNADIPVDEVFGHFEATVPWSLRNLLQRYNLDLGAAVEARNGVALFDLDRVASMFGKQRWDDPPYWYHSKNACALDALGAVAFHFASVVGAMKGRSKKCLVLDLDNTLWGGVIGDDGLEGIRLGNKADGEAFVDLQRYAKALKQRGIVLAVCSKNDESNARLPFENHPDMQLRLDDIAVFVANWENKADNIRHIAATLNIGLDSLVFVDDNPAERDLVARMLPMVSVPQLPDDPALYVRTLQAGRYFETVSFSDEDRLRADSYKANAARSDLQKKFTDLRAYLEDLQMAAVVGEIDSFHLPRAAQLINKSNQFHLTGTRYTEGALKSLVEHPDHIARYFKLRDRFGDNGLISVVILKRDGGDMVIDTWVMSCRVLGREMEEFIASELAALAQAEGARSLIGHYVPSSKNGLVAGLYDRLKFTKSSGTGDRQAWRLDLAEGLEWPTSIRRETPGAAVPPPPSTVGEQLGVS